MSLKLAAWRGLLVLGNAIRTLFILGLAAGLTGPAAEPGTVAPAVELFDDSLVPRIEITIGPGEVNVLRRYRPNLRNPGPRPKVMAQVREGDRVYTNVAVHLKGSFGSFRPIDDRPALTLKFDKQIRGQTFHGLTQISLNNSGQDPSFIREKLCRELFRDIGVPVPRSGFARVILNRRDLGLYVLVEGADETFLKQHFKDDRGTLYDGGYVRDITAPLLVNSGNERSDRSDLKRLHAATRLADPAARHADLARLMDVEGLTRTLALESLIAHWDGYAQNRNNYRIYHDPTTDRLMFIPHGMDLILMPDRIQNPLLPRMVGEVARALMNTPEGKNGFLRQVQEQATNLFTTNALLARVDRIDAMIRGIAPPHQRNAAVRLRSLIQARCSVVADELVRLPENARPLTALTFSATDPSDVTASGRAAGRPEGWRRQMDRLRAQAGGWVLDEAEHDGRPCLRINYNRNRGTASWRSRVLLPAGHYTFVGRAQSTPASEGRGACSMRLRVSGQSQAPYRSGPGWLELEHLIVVEKAEAPMEVELVCETTGTGEAWFDKDSLRILRQPDRR